MKEFLKKFFLLVILCVLAISLVYYGMSIAGCNMTGLASDVMYVINESERTNGCKEVYIGDSVCNQLWHQGCGTEDICYLGSNQGITVVGSYLLLRSYLESNPGTEDVYFLVRPQMLANDLWTDFTYQYFVIPFCTPENMELLDQRTLDVLYTKYGRFFVRNSVIKSTLLNNKIFMRLYLDQIQSRSESKDTHRISETTATYLPLMDEMCKEKGVRFHVVAEPLSDAAENHLWNDFMTDISRYELDGILDGYIDSIDYYPVDWFQDGVHFTDEVMEEYGDEIRMNVLDQNLQR